MPHYIIMGHNYMPHYIIMGHNYMPHYIIMGHNNACVQGAIALIINLHFTSLHS